MGAKQLATDSVTYGKLGVGAVHTRHIRNGAVTDAKIANNAVSSAKLDTTVTSAYEPREGIKKVSFSPSSCTELSNVGCASDVLTLGGLKLHASCEELTVEGDTFEFLAVQASGADGAGGVINAVGQGGSGYGGPFPATLKKQNGFGVDGTPRNAVAVAAVDGHDVRQTGQMIFRRDPDGATVVVNYTSYVVHAGSDRRCEFFGVAVQG